MEIWEALNVFFQWLRDQWPFILLTLFFLNSRWAVWLFRWLRGLGSGPRHQEPQIGVQEEGQPIRLTAKHIKTPSRYPLRGKRVIVTGLVTQLDYTGKEPPTMELMGFPFSIDATLRCVFPKDHAADLHCCDRLQLASVIGTAVENLEVQKLSHSLVLRLVNCQLSQPRFVDQFRNVWRDTPIAVFYRWVKYGF